MTYPIDVEIIEQPKVWICIYIFKSISHECYTCTICSNKSQAAHFLVEYIDFQMNILKCAHGHHCCAYALLDKTGFHQNDPHHIIKHYIVISYIV
jgi:hypothetical protein